MIIKISYHGICKIHCYCCFYHENCNNERQNFTNLYSPLWREKNKIRERKKRKMKERVKETITIQL